MTNEELKNRAKQGATAALGSFAVLSLASYKALHEKGQKAEFKKVAMFAGVVSLLLGVAWSAMPSAKDSPEETYEKVKATLYPIVALMVKRAIEDVENVATAKPQQESQSTAYSTWKPGFNKQSTAFDDSAFDPSKKYTL